MSDSVERPARKAAARRGLGRGLDALMGGGGGGTERPPISATEIELDDIDTAHDQPRSHFTDEGLQELADSIAVHGLLQPILVEPVGRRYRIIAGERRYRAARRAGLNAIPVVVRSTRDEERLALALVENIQREDLTPIEEANAYKRLLDLSGVSQDELARRLGKHRSTIANSLRLLRLPIDVQTAIAEGTITAGHARALLMITDPAERQRLFVRLEKLSVREAEAYAARVRDGAGTGGSGQPRARGSAAGRRDPHLRDLEQRLIDVLGTKVSVRGPATRGKIEISYFSTEELDRITGRLIETAG